MGIITDASMCQASFATSSKIKCTDETAQKKNIFLLCSPALLGAKPPLLPYEQKKNRPSRTNHQIEQ